MSHVDLIFKSISTPTDESIKQFDMLINETITEYNTIRITRCRIYYNDITGHHSSVKNPTGNKHIYDNTHISYIGNSVLCEKFRLTHIIDFVVLVASLSCIVSGFTFPLIGGLLSKMINVAFSSIGYKTQLNAIKEKLLYMIENQRLTYATTFSKFFFSPEKVGNTIEGKAICNLMKCSIIPHIYTLLNNISNSIDNVSTPMMNVFKKICDAALSPYNTLTTYYKSSVAKLLVDGLEDHYVAFRQRLCDGIDWVVINSVGDATLYNGIINSFNAVYNETEALCKHSHGIIEKIHTNKQRLETELQLKRVSLSKLENALCNIHDPVLLQKLQKCIIQGQLYRNSICDKIVSLETRIKMLDMLIHKESENIAQNTERISQLRKSVTEMNKAIVDDI
jgi:hypothetical protein